MEEDDRALSPGARMLFLSLLGLAVAMGGRVEAYPHNAVTCERCHYVPTKFGVSAMTVKRMGESFRDGGRFVPAPEGGIHHRNGESTQSSPSSNHINGERVSLSLLGDGYIEAIRYREGCPTATSD
jgi:hypothetical protein